MTALALKKFHPDNFIADPLEAFQRDAVNFFLAPHGGTGRWVYDENWGEFVKNNPYYHPFLEECGLFALNAEFIAANTAHLQTAVDIGAGSQEAFVRKLLPILSRMPDLHELISIDLSEAFPIEMAKVTGYWLPKTKLTPLNIDYSVEMPQLDAPVLAFYVGSSISNIVLQPQETLAQGITRTLNKFGETLPCGSMLVLSWDSCHDEKQILRAYNHPAFAKMERGLIARMNRELGLKGITEDDFDFVGPWYPERHLFANELEARRNAEFSLGKVTGQIKKGQRFWSGSCYKIPDDVMRQAVKKSAFTFEWVAKGPNMRVAVLAKK